MKLRQKLVVASVAIISTCSANSALACAACFGKSDSDMARGMNAGIFTLLAVIGGVLAGAASFFVFLARRAAAVAAAESAVKKS